MCLAAVAIKSKIFWVLATFRRNTSPPPSGWLHNPEDLTLYSQVLRTSNQKSTAMSSYIMGSHYTSIVESVIISEISVVHSPFPQKPEHTLALNGRGCTRRSFKEVNMWLSPKYRTLKSRRPYSSIIQNFDFCFNTHTYIHIYIHTEADTQNRDRHLTSNYGTQSNYWAPTQLHLISVIWQLMENDFPTQHFEAYDRHQNGGQAEYQDMKTHGNKNYFI
jgi:hypothetical protein